MTPAALAVTVDIETRRMARMRAVEGWKLRILHNILDYSPFKLWVLSRLRAIRRGGDFYGYPLREAAELVIDALSRK